MIIEAARRKGDLAGLVDGFEEPVEALEKRVSFGDGAPEDTEPWSSRTSGRSARAGTRPRDG